MAIPTVGQVQQVQVAAYPLTLLRLSGAALAQSPPKAPKLPQPPGGEKPNGGTSVDARV